MNKYVNDVINAAFFSGELTEEQKAYIIEGYTEETRKELLATAKKKKVLPVTSRLMLQLGIDEETWKTHYCFFRDRNIAIAQLMDKLFQAFQDTGVVRICAYENYGAMLAADTDIALYSSGDVDLFADVEQKQQIEQVLAGFSYYPVRDDNDDRHIATEFSKEQGLVSINVAWKPLIRHSLPMKADTTKHFHWETMGFYKETAIRLPCPETMLYLCFLRIAVHGYSRSPDIRLYIDTYNATRNNPNWKTVMQWAKEDGMVTKFATVAAIARDLIGIDVPEFVLEYAQKDPYSQKILQIAYDFQAHSLRYDPSGLQLLKLEAASDNRSVAALVLQMLFPPAGWLTEYYLSPKERPLRKYINYYKHLL